MTHLQCVACNATYEAGTQNTCPICGPHEGILDVIFDTTRAAVTLSRDTLNAREQSVWRYAELLPCEAPNLPNNGLRTIGWTPIIEAPALAANLGIGRVRLKDDGRSASGSFKDRASVVGVAMAAASGATSIACASTGNAATSMAHCAAVAGIQANIFVARGAPEGKLAQMLAYGARVFEVDGTYDDAYKLSRQSCAEFGWYDRNCAVNPYLVEGKKTAGLEIAEQCADNPPDWVAVSVGDGCTIAGIAKGLRQMRECGVIDWSARVLGVQAEGVAPIMKALETNRLDIPKVGTTYADSINVPVPRNWRKAVNGVRASNGTIIAVSDDEIRNAVATTGRLAGIFAEPAAAAAVAGIAKARQDGVLDPNANVVAMITGNGLKDIRGALSAIGKPTRVKADFKHIVEIVNAD
ncbi:MAG: threonine synthase [Phycisphaerales bacterium]|nr:threonine synthase [Phycisphaerales bacterium]MCB9858038.1 threonine synthase [Phycisphaerales bacterium]MCB9864135.1 threonine synthase [Phycisphaerales bacterium]